jgi:propanol-preferring alcohol dehydrogenase
MAAGMSAATPTTMRAYQLVAWAEPPEFREVDVPVPARDEVLIKVAGVGLCHSDFLFLDTPPGIIPWELPFTLGHESAGWVERLGDDVGDLEVGQAVAVAGIHSCGRCEFCLRGHDNYCPRGASGRGYGEDGGLAQYLVVPRRELVPMSTLDPRRVGPLTDAGATSYHAVKRALPKLVPGSTAVVIGAGGLGSYAVQYLRRLSAAQVIAVDIVQQRIDLAGELGAHHGLLSDDTTALKVRELTVGKGATAVFDFVGDDTTMAMALACAGNLGTIGIVGAGGGTAKVSWGVLPLECDLFIPMAATIADLHEVIALAEAGDLRVEVELFAFDDAPVAYDRFRHGDLRSRAVVTPNG